ncbi:PASTA domain-containing protein [Nocardioides sp. HDW12B]|uniref:Stk1 family PASTA domain-containing Ser/Thr kinase n=1 Tax=Nocardioides sp. HDW12B TaxID=2714939 RepID=UPI00140BF1A1|nr:Stk1 family PASTA domain-containing Ser/Thr kinase [Nocardioides sp. HDW12B]QIK66912.1 PASTA domain-containing protein [Nocardioides sp. HDW12B]
MTGRVLEGRYRVGAKIARGGMATVYEALDLRLNRGCAVKIMHSDLGDDADFRRRFVREAHAAARLSHPNVVSVSDQGDDDGALFLVMEHVEGRTLREVVREEAPMAPERALALLEPVLAALSEAHAAGLVHRDVKPENVLIADDGRIKVADFGLARAFDASVSQTATRGVLIGTVSYLAPELIVDGSADPRVDVYAAGVLLFEMLTGRKPHEGDGAIQIAFKHVNEDIPAPSTCTPAPLPSYVDALVTRATSRDRDRRQADAKVFLQQTRRVSATLRAGVVDDEELTADLLPAGPLTLPGAADEPEVEEEPLRVPLTAATVAADRDDAADDDAVSDRSVPLPDHALPLPDSEETTTIIRVGGLAAAGVAAGSAAGRSDASSRSSVATRTRRPAGQGGPGGPGGTGDRPGVVPGQSGPPHRVADSPAPAGRRPRRRPRKGWVLLLVVALLTVAAGYAGWWFAIGRYTSTPGVINLAVSDAEARAADAGLDLDVTERTFSESVPAGSVIETSPAAGSRIVEGGTIEVVVSKGRERYAVPALAGKPFEDVEAILAERNLTLGEPTKRYSETVAKGSVVAVDPVAGTELRRDSVVTVVVSRGPRPIEIPDFAGRSAERAEERLVELGFDVTTTEENSDTVDKGVVIDQTPDDGTGFKGDEIELVVSKGPVLVVVPDLAGLSVEAATDELAAVGLGIDVSETQLYVGLDTVVRQDVDGGSSIPKGSVVTVGVV